MELQQQLTELTGVITGFRDKAQEEMKTLGATTKTTADQLIALQKQVDAIDVKLAEKHVADAPDKPLEEELKENESVARLMKNKRGMGVITLNGKQMSRLFERKTTITSGTGGTVGQMTTGVLQIDRTPGITPEARQALKVRDLLSARPTQMQVVDFVKVNAPMTIASPQTEASTKAENAVTFTSVSEKVRTLATWIPATRQVLDDFTELMGFLQSTLPYYVNLEEELQLLSGDGTGENLHGLITQATSFLTSQLSNSKGWTKLDIVARTVQQITAAKELQPTFVVCHVNDWWDMRLTKDGFGRYILGDPQIDARPMLWGLDVVPTTSIAAGTFLVGSGSPIASEIRDRMEMQVEISTEHQDFFVKNLVAIRAEKRLALLVKRAASYITGTFTTSP